MSLFGARRSFEEPNSRVDEKPSAAARRPRDVGDRATSVQHEKDALGFYLSGHPLTEFREKIESFADTPIKKLANKPPKSIVTVGGIIRSVRLLLTKRGKYAGQRMAFVKFEDFSGTVDCVIFASIYAECHELIEQDAIVFLKGEVDQSRDEPSLKVEEVIPLDRAKADLTRRLTLDVHHGDDLDLQIAAMKRLLREHPGRIPVAFHVETADRARVLIQAGPGFSVSADPELFRQLEAVLGTASVRYN